MVTRRIVMMSLVCGCLSVGAGVHQVPLNTAPDRVATPLQIAWPYIGTLVPRSASAIARSNWTLGCETLCRDFANYEEYKDYLVPLGIKKIRLQGGWAKTEKQKGVYHFGWLDKIVDDARGRGLSILLETDYGNPIYAGGGGADLAGGFPVSEEALAAWDRWVEAMAVHYKDRVQEWAMWNEPDINKAHTPDDIARFNVRTARIIKRVISDARIAGLSLANNKPALLEACLKAIQREGGMDLFTWFIYHGYAANPDSSYANVVEQQAVLARYSRTARMRQGENGCPSEMAHRFALSKIPWTEDSQAKWDLRRMLGDLGHDVESSIFTICDFNHTGREINRKGLIRANAKKEVIAIKKAYYAVQNLVSVFDDTWQRCPGADVGFSATNVASYVYQNSATKAWLCVFWESDTRPAESFCTRSVTLTSTQTWEEPVWVDLFSGRAYAVPKEKIKRDHGRVEITDVPVYDSPAFITERRALTLAL